MMNLAWVFLVMESEVPGTENGLVQVSTRIPFK